MSNTPGKYSDIHRELIERCRNNDRKAQLELYRLYSGAVYNACLRILRDTGKAEDATQESFILAFNKLSTFKGESSFGAWIKKIAIHKAIDELRKNNIKFEVADNSPEVLQIEVPAPDISENIEILEEQVKAIKEAMHLLPDGYRLVLSLYLFEGYDHEEIAQILSITESTSRSQCTRAKQKLAELLHQKFGFRYERK